MDTDRIVAVASSADDIEAVAELLSGLPSSCGAVFIIVQSLNPGRERLLIEALAERTILSVSRADDGAGPASNLRVINDELHFNRRDGPSGLVAAQMMVT